MDAAASIHKVDACSRRLQVAGLVFLGVGVFCGPASGLEGFFCFFYPAAIMLAVAGLLVRLFGVVQMYLSELCLLALFVGCPLAGVAAWLTDANLRTEELIAVLLACGLALQIVLSGITSGLWIAKATHTTDAYDRIGLMVLFTFTPLTFVGALILLLVGLFAQPAVLFFAFIIGWLGWLLHDQCRSHRVRARRMLEAASGR